MALQGAPSVELPRNLACAISLMAKQLAARERPAALLFSLASSQAVAFERQGHVLVATLTFWGPWDGGPDSYRFNMRRVVPLRLHIQENAKRGAQAAHDDFQRLVDLLAEYIEEEATTCQVRRFVMAERIAFHFEASYAGSLLCTCRWACATPTCWRECCPTG